MKILHLSDLHLGKRVLGFSMIEDQKYILNEIIEILDKQKITTVIIAGDVYDKPVPSAEAVALFDEFLVNLSQRDVNVFVISGNHDSPERIAFGEKLMQKSHVYMSPVYAGKTEAITLEDDYGKINFYLLPFIKPVHVRHFFEEEGIENYTDAMACVISHMNINKDERNVLVCHQFVTGATRSESEEISVGGLDNVDVSVFEPFDYVALGHIHGPQNIGNERIRYCGTLLKYSFSEAEHCKSVTIVELKEKGTMNLESIPLVPLRDMIKIRGLFETVTDKKFCETVDTDSYVQVTLLDEWDIPNAFGKLATVYPNLMQMRYENRRTSGSQDIISEEDNPEMKPTELFAHFFELMNNQPLTKAQEEYMCEQIEAIWGISDETC